MGLSEKYNDAEARALWSRIEGYTQLFREGRIDGFEWFMLSDPFQHELSPGLCPPREEEKESLALFAKSLARFFKEEAPPLSPQETQEALDRLIREHLRQTGEHCRWTPELLALSPPGPPGRRARGFYRFG